MYNLSLHRHGSGVAFDPQKVIVKARAWFPEADFLPGDKAAEEVHRAETLFAEELRQNPAGPGSSVIASLRRRAYSFGPAFAFRIPQTGQDPVRATARGSGVHFVFDEPITEVLRDRILGFLRSLGIGRLEAAVVGDRIPHVLADMDGPSNCLRDDGRVPWMEPMPAEPVASEAG
jgi:hypothetical protein